MSMKKTIDFSSKTEQNTWFNSKVSKTVTNVAFNKLQNLLHIPMDYGEALEYTYVRFKNLDSSKRTYYYFIHSCTLIDDTTVAFQLTLDPIQTFMCEWSIGECMVNRKHCDRWSKNALIPIRITPNVEGINCIYNAFSTNIDNSITFDGKDYFITWLIIGCIFKDTLSSAKPTVIRNIIVPLLLDVTNNQFNFQTNVTMQRRYNDGSIADTQQTAGSREVIQGTFFERVGINIDTVQYILTVPFNCFNASLSGTETMIVNVPSESIRLYPKSGNSGTNEPLFYFDGITDNEINFTFVTEFPKPTKPTISSKADYKFEPALFMEPFIKRCLTSASVPINFNFGDKYIINYDTNIDINIVVSASQQNFIIRPSKTGNIETDGKFSNQYYNEGVIATAPINSMDVFRDAWLSYCLTQRAEDRQILSNTIISQTAKDALFMGYGGALVGSRGGGLTDVKGIGKAVVPATGLAVGASLIGSAVNSHYSWENQKLNERKIQNQPNTLMINGNNGLSNLTNVIGFIYATYFKCDDVNFNRAYENFRKYGYEINEWQIPNIRSRRYYDYILTDGAIINGSMNQQIKEEIANIFDSGITIFHADYSTTLDYPENENIERTLM